MSIALRGSATIYFMPDGVGPMEIASAQKLTISLPVTIIPGGNQPTSANFQTAFNLLAAQVAGPALAPFLGQIQGWSTGGN